MGMLFNSYPFLFLFLPLTLLGYYLISKKNLQLWFLFLSSVFFYAYWSTVYVFLLLFTVVLDFYIAKAIYYTKTQKMRKTLLLISVVANLSVLGFFKYYNFFADSLNGLFHVGGGQGSILPALQLVLPIGISFYTFQSMSYVIDVYRRVSDAHARLLEFAGYVTLFPHQISGPLVRHNQIVPQLEGSSTYVFNAENFIEDMDFDNSSEWARDSFLYRKVLAQYKESVESRMPTFNQLMTVYTHGSYVNNQGDGGIGDYSHRLSVSMSDYLDFEQKVVELAGASGRNVIFVLVGDHKPALSKTFYDRDISADYYMSGREAPTKEDYRFSFNLPSEGLMEIGRVPVFIKVVAPKRKNDLDSLNIALDKPMYCFPGYLASIMAESQSKYFSRLRDICENNAPRVLMDPEWQRKAFPLEVYAEQIF